METGIKVGEIMTRNIVCVPPKVNLKDCVSIMVKKKVGNLLITEPGKRKLLGIVTEKDIMWAIAKTSSKQLKSILAEDIMKRKILTIKPSADIGEAIQKLSNNKMRRLPVIENGNLIGIITEKDILKIEPELFQTMIESIQIKEETRKLASLDPENSILEEGICDECSNVDLLREHQGLMVCQSCLNQR